MLVVSTFELLFERNVPKTVTDAIGFTVGGRVYQGYFLIVANLGAVAHEYDLEFTITPPVLPTDPIQRFNRTLDSAYYVVELSSVAAPLPPGPPIKLSDTQYSISFGIPARETALVSLFPPFLPYGVADPKRAFSDVDPTVEIRGFATLFLRGFSAGLSSRVLLTPELRGTFLPETLPPAAGAANPEPPEFEEVIRGLPLSSGTAGNTIYATFRPPIGVLSPQQP